MSILPAVASAQTVGPTTTSTPIPATLTDWSNQPLTFPKFNASLGTLTSVRLQFTGDITTQLTITNNAGSASNGTAATRVRFTVQDTGNNLVSNVPAVITDDFNYNLGSGAFVNTGPLAKSASSNNLYSSAAVLAAFTGTGNIVLSAGTATLVLQDNTGGNTDVTQTTSASLTGTVTYTYTPLPDLTISKTHAGANFRPGDVVTFTISVSNVGGGPTDGTNYSVVDTLPAGMTATGISGTGWACVLGTLTCTRNTVLNNGSSSTDITLTASINAGITGTLINNVAVSGGGQTVTTNDTDDDSITSSVPDLRLAKTHAGTSFRPGDTVTFTLTPNNTLGLNSTSGTYEVVDTLPAGLTAVSMTGTNWTCVLGTLTCTNSTVIAAGATGVEPITLTATINAGITGTLTNNARVDDGGELNDGNNTASDPITVTVPDLQISKTHTGSTFAPGDTVTFTLTVNNTLGGNSTTGTYTVVDTLPAGLTATAISGTGWTCVLGTLTCTNATVIAAGATSTQPITLTATVNAGVSGTLVNNVQVSGGGELNTTNNTDDDSITTGVPDLRITKTHTGSGFLPGSTVTFTLTPNNTLGTLATSGTYTVTDTLPAGLTAVSFSGTGWTCAAVPTLSCTNTTVIAAGAAGVQPITLVATVNAGVSGTLVNNTAISGGGETNTTNNTATDSIVVTLLPDLTLSKTHTGTTFLPGGSVTFTLTPNNIGGGATEGTYTVTDTLPAGLTATSISGTGWTCAALPTLSCTNTTVIAAGGTGTQPITLVASISGTASGTLVNNAAVSGGGETNTTNNTATDSISVGLPDLTLSKTHTGTSFAPGGTVTFTLTPNNIGSVATEGTYTVTDTLPAGLTATSISGTGWTCAALPTLSCTNTTVIAAGGTGTQPITLVASISGTATGTLVNNAVVSGGGETNTTNNTATDSISVGVPDLTLSKTHTGTSFAPGGSVTFTLTPNNIGSVATSGTYTVTDTLPTGLTATSISGTGWTCAALPALSCTNTTVIAAGGTGTQPITLVASISGTATGTLVNNAEVSGGGETNTTNNTATDSITVGIPDLTLSKTHTGTSFSPGGSVTFTLTPNNIGGQPTTGTYTVTDTLPAELTATSISGTGWTCAALPTLSCTNTTVIAAGGTGTQPITLVASISTAATGTLVNNAVVSGGGETNTTNNTATDSISVTGPDLTLSKSHTGTTFLPGGTVTFTLTPNNVGSAATSGTYTVTDTLPTGLTATSISGTGWTCAALPTLSCTNSTVIAAGGTGTQPITLVASISTTASGTLVNNARVDGGGETNTTNNTATDSITLGTLPDLVLSKSHTGTSFNPGDTVTFTLTPRNIGATATFGTYTVTDTLPSTLTAVSMSGTGWTCAALPTLSCTNTTVIAAGATGTQPITLVTTIHPAATGTIINNARVDGGGESNTSNNTATDSLSVTGEPDLTIDKSHTGTVFAPGGTVTFSLRVTNVGNQQTAGLVTVTDTLPAGLTATAISGSGWSCAALPTLSCTRSDSLARGNSYPDISLTAGISLSATGTLTNTTVVGGGGETNTSNNTDTDSIELLGVIDLTISKSHAPALARGTPAQYTILVTNVGARASEGVVSVTDALPAGLTVTGLAGTGWTCTLSPLRCERPDVLGPGASYPPITLSVNVDGDAPSSIINVAVVSGGNDSNSSNNTATDPDTLTNTAPALSLSKTHVGTFIQGGSGSYRLTVTNTGSAPTAGPISITDPLATGLIGTGISGSGWDCALTTLTCTRNDVLAPGESFEPITVMVNIAQNAPTDITNIAVTSGGGSLTSTKTTAENKVAVAGVISALVVEKDADRDFAQIGDLLGYTLIARNLSGQPYTGAVVKDTLPVGFEYVAGSGRRQSGFDAEAPLDPDVSGQELTFSIGTIGTLPTRITYVVRIGPLTRLGPNVNSARLVAVGTTNVTSSSRETKISVEIDPGGFTMRQFLTGRVFEDANDNGVFDENEPAVAGVRLFTSTGMSVTTDRMGLYNVPFVPAGSIVISLDPATVPKGYKVATGNRAEAESWSRLVRTPLMGGAMLRQNFGLLRCPYCDVAGPASATAASAASVSGLPAARLVVEPQQLTLPGDGRSSMSVRVRVLDEQGNPTSAPEVRIRTSAGQFLPLAIKRETSGIQPVFGANTEPQLGETTETVPQSMQGALAEDVQGEVTFTLLAAHLPGDAQLVAEAGGPEDRITNGADITFTPEERTPVLVTNGEIAFGRAAPDALIYGESPDQVSRHLEAFMQTPVGGPSLLTLAYSSRPRINEANGNAGLFQIDPLDRVYPLFGDSSTRYQVAQSNSKFYGRLDFWRSHVMFGDLRMSEGTDTSHGLGGYNRNLIGAAIHLESTNRQSITLKAARPDTSYARDLFIGSAFGLVRLSHTDIVPGTETAVVEVRDARNPAVLISREPLVRSVDYALDHLTGGVFFLRSLNAYDQTLNLVQVVFTYEHESAGVTSKVYSARTDLRYKGLRFGLGVTDQQHPTFGSFAVGELTIQQALPRSGQLNIEVPISHGLALAAGYTASAGVRASGSVNGAAVRVDIDQPFALMDGRFRGSFAHTEDDFFNPFGSTVIPGAQIGRAAVELSPSSNAQLTIGFTDERNDTDLVDNARQTGSFEWKQAPVDWLRLTGGYDFRDFNDRLQDRGISSHQVAGGLDWRPTSRFSASVRREQNLGEDTDPTYPNQTLLNANYQASETARLFITQRFASAPITPIGDLSRSGFFLRPTKNQTSIGVEDRWGRYTSMRSRYMVEEGANGTDTFAVIGLVNRIPLNDRFTVEVAGERGQLITGTDSSFNTGSLGFSWQPEANFRTSTRYELRNLGGFGHVFTTGAAGQVAEGVTVLGRYQASSAAYQAGTAAIDILSPRASNSVLGQQAAANHSLAALAWRPWRNDRQILLFSYNRRSMDRRGERMAPHTDGLTQLSADGFYQPHRILELYGRVAMSDRSFNYEAAAATANRTWLTQARAQTRLGRRFDVAIEGRRMFQPSTSIEQTMLAAEGGVWITKDVRGGIGYNFKSDDVLAANFLGEDHKRGVYLVLSTKLSSMFNLFEPVDCGCPPPAPAPKPNPPVVIQPIAGVNDICTGDAIVLRTSATGGTPGATMVYQWVVNGAPVAGVSGAELSLPAMAPGTTRTVTVRATAGDQSAAADPVTVRVFTQPTLQFAVSPAVAFDAAVIALTATPTAASGNATVAFTGEGVSGSTFDPGAVGGFDPANRLREQTRTITITATATDRCKQTATAAASVTVTMRPAASRRDIVFPNRSARVNNAAKRYLIDELTPRLRDDPNATVILVGHRDTTETGAAAATLDRNRALNTAAVLSAGTGICPALDLGRVQIATAGTDQTTEPLPFSDASVRERRGSATSPTDERARFRRVEVWFVPGNADRLSVNGLAQAPAAAIRALGCPR